MKLRTWQRVTLAAAVLLACGFALPERAVIPVLGASAADWNHESFWHEPWGVSGVHKGIDIFHPVGTPVVAATAGVVVYRGDFGNGGLVVAVLGPRWRIHYYAHLSSARVHVASLVTAGEPIGALGTSGNALGKPPHLHYTVLSIVPLPWRATTGSQGWKRMFFVNPQDVLRAAT